jgi:hypothetical protein
LIARTCRLAVLLGSTAFAQTKAPARPATPAPAKAPAKAAAPAPPPAPTAPAVVLRDEVWVTWYGNPNSNRMGILGERRGAALANGLKEQAAAYQKVTTKRVVPAYHVVATVAQATAQRDGTYRRRESPAILRRLLDDARANNFKLIVDIQTGWSNVADEVEALRPFLVEPDVHLALDPEFSMSGGIVPGKKIGSMPASEVNAAIDFLEKLITDHKLPPKVLIIHQFTWNMLPDKANIKQSSMIDIVLDMDGFGGRPLKLSTYRSILKQGALPLTGFKLFYKQDTNLMTPAQVMGLTPSPAVVIYQ